MEQAKKIVTDITPTREVLVTEKTASWLDTLYKSGMVSFGKDREVVLNEEIRELLRGVHAVLAGGKVSVNIEDDGGLMYEQLEEIFQISHDQVNISYKNREANFDDFSVLVP